MPPVLAVAPLLALAAGGITTGLEVSGAIGGGGGGNQTAALQQQNEQQQAALKAQEEQAFKHFAPDVQSATGGSLSDASFAQTVAELAGNPSDIGLAQQTIFGNTNNPGSGLPSTQSGLASGGIAT